MLVGLVSKRKAKDMRTGPQCIIVLFLLKLFLIKNASRECHPAGRFTIMSSQDHRCNTVCRQVVMIS